MGIGVAAACMLIGMAAGAQGQVPGGGFPFGGALRGVTQIKGRVVCVGCSLEEARAADPTLHNLYELRHAQGRAVIQVDAVDDAARWESIAGLAHQVWLRTPDNLFQRLTAEENLFKKIEITGLLSSARTLDVGAVIIPGPSITEQARAAGEQAQAAAVRADDAAVRAEDAAVRAEQTAKRVAQTVRRVEAMVKKLDSRSAAL